MMFAANDVRSLREPAMNPGRLSGAWVTARAVQRLHRERYVVKGSLLKGLRKTAVAVG
jgi:hypothetical protein